MAEALTVACSELILGGQKSGKSRRAENLAAAWLARSPDHRAVLIATELKGKSFRELSEEWDEPMGTLLSRKSRAVKTLRKLLEEERTPPEK